MECGRNTHTYETNSIQLHAHRQSNQSPKEKRWVLRANLKDTTEYIYICYKVWCGIVCCMMWNVFGLDDGLQSVKWCRMVWWRRAYGVKWCREIAMWCGMSWCDFKCFVVWIYKVMSSVQNSLLFLYYVVFSVMSCVSRIQCTQCSASVYSVGSAL